MKKQLLIFIALVLSADCATAEVKRDVVDNILHSSYPSLSLAIAPEYQYVGHTKDEKTHKAINGTLKKHRYDYYIFIQSDKSNTIQKCVTVTFQRIETRFISDFNRSVKNKLESGIYDFNGEKYQYYSKIASPSPT